LADLYLDSDVSVHIAPLLLHDAWRRWPGAFGLVLPAHPGILVVDQLDDRAVADAVIRFLAADPPASLPNALYWWRATGGWHHQLPIDAGRRTLGPSRSAGPRFEIAELYRSA
jgi:hypothetical protein